jgi:hypothetical protein
VDTNFDLIDYDEVGMRDVCVIGVAMTIRKAFRNMGRRIWPAGV